MKKQTQNKPPKTTELPAEPATITSATSIMDYLSTPDSIISVDAKTVMGLLEANMSSEDQQTFLYNGAGSWPAAQTLIKQAIGQMQHAEQGVTHYQFYTMKNARNVLLYPEYTIVLAKATFVVPYAPYRTHVGPEFLIAIEKGSDKISWLRQAPLLRAQHPKEAGVACMYPMSFAVINLIDAIRKSIKVPLYPMTIDTEVASDMTHYLTTLRTPAFDTKRQNYRCVVLLEPNLPDSSIQVCYDRTDTASGESSPILTYEPSGAYELACKIVDHFTIQEESDEHHPVAGDLYQNPLMHIWHLGNQVTVYPSLQGSSDFVGSGRLQHFGVLGELNQSNRQIAEPHQNLMPRWMQEAHHQVSPHGLWGSPAPFNMMRPQPPQPGLISEHRWGKAARSNENEAGPDVTKETGESK